VAEVSYRPHTDEDELLQTYLGSGQAHHVSEPDREEPTRPLTRLYVPDPEQHSGWREWYIRPAQNTRRHQQRTLGFRRPR
jgi:hypothetical protein